MNDTEWEALSDAVIDAGAIGLIDSSHYPSRPHIHARWGWAERSARRSAFVVMAMFVDERGAQGLDSRLLSDIRGLAASALDDPELIMEAIDLSVLLGDAELAGKVNRLATAPSAVPALGITDAGQIADIKERARRMLRDPTPWWYDFEWWTDGRLQRCMDGDSRESGVCRRLLIGRR